MKYSLDDVTFRSQFLATRPGVCALTIPGTLSLALQEFAAKSASIHGLAIASFEPDVAINVDWTGSRALVALTALLTIKPRVIHLNFRVFFLSDGVPLKGEDAEFYMSAEAEAMQAAKMCVALNKCDMRAMLSLDPDKKHDVRVLSPPLRKDIALGAMKEGAASWNGSAARTLILFCGRISREKNVLAFVEACENAGLSDIGCAPAIVGHAADGDEYAQECLERVRKMPGAEVYGFLSAPQLSKVFGRCRLLLHPAHYEAWGMVIAEAAAYGVPAIVHSPNAQSECMVGVCELLPIGDATIGFDFTKDGTMTGKELKSIAKNVDRLEALSKRARQLSLAWDEAAHARRIDDLVKELFSAD